MVQQPCIISNIINSFAGQQLQSIFILQLAYQCVWNMFAWSLWQKSFFTNRRFVPCSFLRLNLSFITICAFSHCLGNCSCSSHAIFSYIRSSFPSVSVSSVNISAFRLSVICESVSSIVYSLCLIAVLRIVRVHFIQMNYCQVSFCSSDLLVWLRFYWECLFLI